MDRPSSGSDPSESKPNIISGTGIAADSSVPPDSIESERAGDSDS
jgi:hypothetical protein